MTADVRDPEYAERLAAQAPDEYLRRREFLARAAMTAGLGAGMATVLAPDTLVAEAAARQRRQRMPGRRDFPIDTIVVLMMENRSFDHYLGWMPKADGRQAGLTYTDREGRRHRTHRLTPDWQGCAFSDPDHSWYGGRTQLDHGHLDGFLLSGDNDIYSIGYYGPHDLPFLPSVARAFTTYDRMFCSLLSSTYPNRYYMWAGQSFGVKRNLIAPEAGFPDGFPGETIFGALDRKGVSGRYFYSDLPVSALFQEGLAYTSPIEDYYDRCASGTLPRVSFVDPAFIGEDEGTSGDEHPHGDVRVGQAFMSDVVHAFIESRHWRRGALFIVYDEWGGFFEHVKPPRVPDGRSSRNLDDDFGQTGFRIPGVVVSPYARRDHVSHIECTPVSILNMISWRWGLEPLTKRVAHSGNIARSLDFRHRPRFHRPDLPTPRHIVARACAAPPEGAAAAQRPKEHDLARLRDSGLLDRLGHEYRPATHERIFREPSAIREGLARSAGS